MMSFFFLYLTAAILGGSISWGAMHFFDKWAEKKTRRKLRDLDRQYPNTVYREYEYYWYVETHDYITDIIRGSYIYTDDERQVGDARLTHYYKDGYRHISGRTFLLLHLLHKMGIRVKRDVHQ